MNTDGPQCLSAPKWAADYVLAYPQCVLPRDVRLHEGRSTAVAGSHRLDLHISLEGGNRRMGGFPRGAVARLVVLYVQTWLRSNQNDTLVPLGDALMTWLRDVCDITVDPLSVGVEVARLSQCSWTLAETVSKDIKQPVWFEFAAPGAASICTVIASSRDVPDQIKISTGFARLAREHCPLIDESDLCRISDNPLVLDVCVLLPFLAKWQRRGSQPCSTLTVTWSSLIELFGIAAAQNEEILRVRVAAAFHRGCKLYGGMAKISSLGIALTLPVDMAEPGSFGD